MDKFKDPRRRAIFEQVELTREQEQQIDSLYLENYGKKIPYTWHRYFTAYTGKFDFRYFPELLFIPEFENYMNFDKKALVTFADKNVLPYLAKSVGIKMPEVVLSSTVGVLRDNEGRELPACQLENFLSDVGEVFMKPTVDSNSGKNCFVADIHGGTDRLSGKRLPELLNILGDNFVVQERLHCHETISRIYSDSVNTFRVIVYRWKGEYCHMPVIMRLGRGGNHVDNAHAGGMFIAVDDDGSLHDKAFTEFKEVYTSHPDTGILYEGCKIPDIPKVIEAAKTMSLALPQLGCINWDFTIDRQGEPVLIEANLVGGSIWMSEMSHGCGCFGERTGEILRWLRLMKSLPARERYRYKFGRMEPQSWGRP